jgi:hypothetical protein
LFKENNEEIIKKIRGDNDRLKRELEGKEGEVRRLGEEVQGLSNQNRVIMAELERVKEGVK